MMLKIVEFNQYLLSHVHTGVCFHSQSASRLFPMSRIVLGCYGVEDRVARVSHMAVECAYAPTLFMQLAQRPFTSRVGRSRSDRFEVT